MANEGMHKPNDFTPVVGALKLADHVIKITDNFNKFPDFEERPRKNPDGTVTAVYIQRQDSLVNWVRDQAKEIYILTYTANAVNVLREPWRRDERFGKQQRAIELCTEHFAAIQLCAMHFHLSSKKVKYWGEMTKKLREAITGWHESDKRRYQGL